MKLLFIQKCFFQITINVNETQKMNILSFQVEQFKMS